MTAETLLRLETKFPHTRWREPLPTTWSGKQTYACRVCVALDGLKIDSPHQWPTLKQAQAHLRREHLPKD